MNGERLISENSVGIYLRGRGERVSTSFVLQLDAKVKEILEAAIKRAERNGRSTVMAQDL